MFCGGISRQFNVTDKNRICALIPPSNYLLKPLLLNTGIFSQIGCDLKNFSTTLDGILSATERENFLILGASERFMKTQLPFSKSVALSLRKLLRLNNEERERKIMIF
jgi:hypothetical protein